MFPSTGKEERGMSECEKADIFKHRSHGAVHAED